MHHVDHFPPVNGPSMMGSVLNDPGCSDETSDTEIHHHFAYKEKSIITIIDVPESTLFII